uniref:Uncharacterized protein n=4 Tax=Avena sativa TaxID=4498 RepID=A0ACD5ZP07_AVESA
MATGAADEELHGVLIVGGGICGLGTALALHIKGINRLLVLEKGESLRATGAGISIQANGWRALDQLKVGDELRKLALPLTGMEKKCAIHGDKILEISYRTECRCLKRSDLVETLARSLPGGCIRFECQVDAISVDTTMTGRWPIVSTSNGATIRAKVVIGCDGSNSVVAKFLGLRSLRLLPMWAARGLTTIPEGHGFGNRFQQLVAEGVSFRLTPIDDKTLHFNAVHFRPPNPKEYTCSHHRHRDPMLIRQLAMKAMPDDVAAVVRRCDTASLSLAQLCYRAPWHMLLEPFHMGTVTVAGDAMHAMGPFIGQGGSCSLEDAVVLARCLAPTTVAAGDRTGCIEEAIVSYVQQRRGRILRLSLQSFLNGQLIAASSWLQKMMIKAAMAVFFPGNSHAHTNYDCGSLS